MPSLIACLQGTNVGMCLPHSTERQATFTDSSVSIVCDCIKDVKFHEYSELSQCVLEWNGIGMRHDSALHWMLQITPSPPKKKIGGDRQRRSVGDSPEIHQFSKLFLG